MLLIDRPQILQTETFISQDITFPAIVATDPARAGCARRHPICTREAKRFLSFDGGMQVANDEAVAVMARKQVHLEDRVAGTRFTARVIGTFQGNAMDIIAVCC